MSTPSHDLPLAAAAGLAEQLQAALNDLAVERHRTQELTARVNEFARQVTADFEELAWLRECANCIDLVDVRHDVPELAKMVLPSLREIINAENISLWSHNPGDPNIVPACISGQQPIGDADFQNLISQFAPAAARGPVVRNAAVGKELPITEMPALRSFILLRVGKGRDQFGWLLALNKQNSEPDPRDSRSCDALSAADGEFGTFEAAMLGTAAVLLGTHHRNLKLFREKEEMFLGITRALINAIDAKDSYTCGHSDRVARIARRLAAELSFSEEEVEKIYLAGLLHDIGKIGVPDHVLLKPGRLTEDEFAQIKLHPEIGYRILEPVSQLAYVFDGVLHHHENYNGQGYPHQLAGEDIPIFARIIAVADAFDAMTSTRLYRPSLGTERAEQILRSGAGQQWDATVVAAFFRARSDIHQICGFDAVKTEPAPGAPPSSDAGTPGSSDTITVSMSELAAAMPPLEVLVPI